MLPPHIIRELLERERRRRPMDEQQPRLDLPLPEPGPVDHGPPAEAPRGVHIIPLWG